MTDTHDEWIDPNGPKSRNHDGPVSDKAEMQEQARQDKAEAAQSVKHHAYRVYRRAGLAPWCAIRFMIQHKVSF